jgi:hypothetical protein
MSQFIRFRKSFACSALIIIFIISLGVVIKANAASAVVFVDPSSQEVSAIGGSFTVNVSISGVSDLYGYDLKLYYNSTFLNGTKVTEGSFLGESAFFDVFTFADRYNLTEGVVWVFATLQGLVPGVNGGGVLFTVKFKSLASGTSVPLSLAEVSLVDSNDSPISYSLSEGTVTIVPEFTSVALFVTLLAASISAILIGKRAARRRFHR